MKNNNLNNKSKKIILKEKTEENSKNTKELNNANLDLKEIAEKIIKANFNHSTNTITLTQCKQNDKKLYLISKNNNMSSKKAIEVKQYIEKEKLLKQENFIVIDNSYEDEKQKTINLEAGVENSFEQNHLGLPESKFKIEDNELTIKQKIDGIYNENNVKHYNKNRKSSKFDTEWRTFKIDILDLKEIEKTKSITKKNHFIKDAKLEVQTVEYTIGRTEKGYSVKLKSTYRHAETIARNYIDIQNKKNPNNKITAKYCESDKKTCKNCNQFLSDNNVVHNTPNDLGASKTGTPPESRKRSLTPGTFADGDKEIRSKSYDKFIDKVGRKEGLKI